MDIPRRGTYKINRFHSGTLKPPLSSQWIKQDVKIEKQSFINAVALSDFHSLRYGKQLSDIKETNCKLFLVCEFYVK